MNRIGRHTQKFARYLRSTRAVSALEYAIVVGIAVVAVVGAYEAFRSDIIAAMTALRQQIGGADGG